MDKLIEDTSQAMQDHGEQHFGITLTASQWNALTEVAAAIIWPAAMETAAKAVTCNDYGVHGFEQIAANDILALKDRYK